MKKEHEKQFLAVAPAGMDNVFSFRALQPYIYKIILSQPCPELLTQISAEMTKTDINGILTRGSLAQYLYANHVPVPIFTLEYQTYTLLNLLQQCVETGHHKICIFEIESAASEQAFHAQHADLIVGSYEFHYSKLNDRASVESEINDRLKRDELDIVVGDVEPIMIAKELGLPYQNFIIDERSYYNAIQEATYVTETTQKEKAQDQFISLITNIISEAVIISDNTGRILRFNLPAERILVKGEHCDNVQTLFGIDLQTLLNLPPKHLAEIREKKYVINVIPRVIGTEQMYVFLLSSVNYVEDMELSIRRQNQERGLTAKTTFRDIIWRDPSSRELVKTAKRYAKSNGSVLIHGETGTGKELIASSIHNESLRANGPFVAVNCATFNENLMESELFGYEKGAFTGALPGGKQGLFELAHRGTLFLDEIGELPLPLQAKLLRVLQEKEVMRIGGNRIIPVDVRIIAATNKNLQEMVKKRSFREDLYYRLALLEIEIPPLKERKQDLVPLFASFLAEMADSEKRVLYWDNDSVLEPILTYNWPGNIRELRNFAERIVLLCESYQLTQPFVAEMISHKHNTDMDAQFSGQITDNLKELERNYLLFLLDRFNGDKEKVCSYLHISKPTLWRKLSTASKEARSFETPDSE
ncbi:sigma 54-interacting transcriptional regulator [Oscillibacter sp.]|uniref:sigma 54-interacting transcriptional regulator n=1 Tax=Oscillibacter sp. TaxID=1945593 RepID=UPI0028985096|nr:sigma 54-interacting transcriptional regulator [Oscillibacter sp.]